MYIFAEQSKPPSRSWVKEACQMLSVVTLSVGTVNLWQFQAKLAFNLTHITSVNRWARREHF